MAQQEIRDSASTAILAQAERRCNHHQKSSARDPPSSILSLNICADFPTNEKKMHSTKKNTAILAQKRACVHDCCL